jgi:signal transduction histidine kinase
LPVLTALLVVGGVGFYSAYHQSQEIYDTELAHVASLMLSLLSAEDQEEALHKQADENDAETNSDIIEMGNDFDKTDQRNERKLAFRIWKGSRLLFYSKDAAGFGEKRDHAGFSNQLIQGDNWRLYILPDTKSGYTLEVAQKQNVRTALITRVLTTIFSPLVLLLPIIVILTWLGMRAGLKPLIAVSDAVGQRSSLDLTPLALSQSPDEITPLLHSINGLLANLDYALSKERRFTDSAAHELRTPIAIFKTQAQTALKSTDDAERRMILEAQVMAADRATNMVDQLLTLARLEQTDLPAEILSLDAMALDLVKERIALAQQQFVTLDALPLPAVSVKGNKQLLTILLANLIDNAVKYTPAHGKVTVELTKSEHTAVFTVSDTGPGIPEDQLPYVTERFYRVSHHPQPGTGLGLAIVKRAADIMGATLTLKNKAEIGLEASLQFKTHK